MKKYYELNGKIFQNLNDALREYHFLGSSDVVITYVDGKYFASTDVAESESRKKAKKRESVINQLLGE